MRRSGYGEILRGTAVSHGIIDANTRAETEWSRVVSYEMWRIREAAANAAAKAFREAEERRRELRRRMVLECAG